MPRKVAFSGKQKKRQLKEKKQRKADGPKYLTELSDDEDDETSKTQPSVTMDERENVELHEGIITLSCSDVGNLAERLEVQKINQQPQKTSDSKVDVNSFRLHFFKESDEVIKRKRKDAQRPIKSVGESCLEYKLEEVYPTSGNLNFPKRPPWNYSLTKEQLETREHDYFANYVQAMINQPRVQGLSYFELNLETWRQLWRVLEISDILLVIADIRYPILHIPPSLIQHIRSDLGKHVVIVLNKVDFVPPTLALAWKRYVQAQYPGVGVVFFSSFPRQSLDAQSAGGLSHKMYKRPFQGQHTPIGPEAIYDQCRDIVQDKVDLSSWKQQLEDDQCDAASSGEPHTHSQLIHQDNSQLYRDGILTIGCIGYPNVGKSSVLNALLKRKAVSVSQTPGHTKHLQTHFLSSTVKLCDCPGLVFPSMVSKSLQVIAGIFPVAQVREPFSVVAYLARRINLPSLLNLNPPSPSPKKTDEHTGQHIWSALDICEAFATKRGFFTAKAGRPDSFRGANKILRLSVAGQICLCFRPVGYAHSLANLSADPEREELEKLFARHAKATHEETLQEEQHEDSEEEDFVHSDGETDCDPVDRGAD